MFKYRPSLLDMVKVYHRETQLFELSPDANREELKIKKKRRHFDMVLLQWLPYNGLVAMVAMYANRSTILLDNEPYYKKLARRQGTLS